MKIPRSSLSYYARDGFLSREEEKQLTPKQLLFYSIGKGSGDTGHYDCNHEDMVNACDFQRLEAEVQHLKSVLELAIDIIIEGEPDPIF